MVIGQIMPKTKWNKERTQVPFIIHSIHREINEVIFARVLKKKAYGEFAV